MPVLQSISEDFRVPILYLTYDSQTSDTGLDTRVRGVLRHARHEEGEKRYGTDQLLSGNRHRFHFHQRRHHRRRDAHRARSYLWTEGNPRKGATNVIAELRGQIDADKMKIVGAGTTAARGASSAR